MRVVLAFLAVVALSFGLPCPNTPPTWPSAYAVKGAIDIPYAELHEPFEAWYDAEEGNSRIDYYHGTSKNFQLKNYPNSNGSTIVIIPITTETYTNKITCANVGPAGVPQTVLPDLTDFKCVGHGWINGGTAQKWTFTFQNMEKMNSYTMWIRWKVNKKTNKSIAVPVYYEMKGFDYMIGSHIDHYHLSYHNYRPAKPRKAVWDLPKSMTCGGFPHGETSHTAMMNPMKEFIHNYDEHIENSWQDFISTHKKQFTNSSDHAMRRYIFKQNHRLVHSHNRANHRYKLALNHLADWTKEELKVLRGRNPSATRTPGSAFPYTEENLNEIAESLPESVDWRLNGAVSPVKDQSICGSCWSFGTTGTIEGAYFLKTGTLISLSEQALVDCSWGFGNGGCAGGNDFLSYKWIMKHGGIPLEEEYGPYLAIDGRCHVHGMKLHANITGWVDVKPLNETALKVAIFKNGPISVAINAALTTFSFYSEGLYDDPDCKGGVGDLDHAVLVVGYGFMDDTKYWLIKNSWSTWWGNDGYMLINAVNNICGVMTSPTYVTM